MTHVLFRHASLWAGPAKSVDVDAELLGDLADERRRPRPPRLYGTRPWGLTPGHVLFRRLAIAADGHEHRADRHDLALGDEDTRHDARGWRRDLDGRLVRLDLDERIVLGHLLPLGDEPPRDLAFREALAEVGEFELVRHLRPFVKRTASCGNTAWTPTARLTICVTRRSTTRLASASASRRSRPCSRAMRSSIASVAIAAASSRSTSKPNVSQPAASTRSAW